MTPHDQLIESIAFIKGLVALTGSEEAKQKFSNVLKQLEHLATLRATPFHYNTTIL